MKTLYISTDDGLDAIRRARQEPDQADAALTACPTHDRQHRPAYLVRNDDTNRKFFIIVKEG